MLKMFINRNLKVTFINIFLHTYITNLLHTNRKKEFFAAQKVEMSQKMKIKNCDSFDKFFTFELIFLSTP